jgi:ribonuclease HI
MLNGAGKWEEDTLVNASTSWFKNKVVREFRYFPIVVCWAIQRSHNESIFQNCRQSPEQVFYRNLYCYEEYKDQSRLKEPHQNQIDPLMINERRPWHFFDGASNDNPGKCGAGGCLYLNPSHVVFFSLGMGLGSNNWAELSTLAALLRLAVEIRVEDLQVHGDSKLIIHWLNGTSNIQNLRLKAVMNQILAMKLCFQSVYLIQISGNTTKKLTPLQKQGYLWKLV